MPEGIIKKGIGGFYYVTAGSTVYECKARGLFRKDNVIPLPGDRVGIQILDEEKRLGNIEEIFPRSSLLVRPAVANVNQVILVISMNSPVPDFMLVDKLIITAFHKDIQPVLCINKIDLGTNEERSRFMGIYASAGIRVIETCTKQNIGFEALQAVIKNKITAFAGQSGVGKSTLLNHILNTCVIKTGEISERNDRGRHTTRHGEMWELAQGGFVLDTPGFSSFELSGIKYSDLTTYYHEFSNTVDVCRFYGCSHISEPDCCVKEAVEKEEISRERYLRYIELYQELKKLPDYNTKKRK